VSEEKPIVPTLCWASYFLFNGDSTRCRTFVRILNETIKHTSLKFYLTSDRTLVMFGTKQNL
jgi:hypothetical protein